MRKSLSVFVMLASVLLSNNAMHAEEASRWESRIQAFEEQDKLNPPPQNAILFVGSSSIVYWKTLAEDMSPLIVINRGFGGSQMFELNQFRDRIVTNYKPRAIVTYEGDNDVAAGKGVDEILASYDDFISHIDETLPETDICFIAVKPSVARWQMWETQAAVNAGLQERANARDDLCYLDIAQPMLLKDGTVRTDIFVPDNLHLNGTGYAIWTDTIKPILLERYGEN